jgi:hypothetical protein
LHLEQEERAEDDREGVPGGHAGTIRDGTGPVHGDGPAAAAAGNRDGGTVLGCPPAARCRAVY